MNKRESIHKRLMVIGLSGIFLLLLASLEASASLSTPIEGNKNPCCIKGGEGVLNKHISDGGNLAGTLPGQATLKWPKGLTGTTNPTYTWHAVPGSTQYRLRVYRQSGDVINKLYNADDVTLDSTCSAPSEVPLSVGNDYTWRIQTINSQGNGPWSAGMHFEVDNKTPGTPRPISPGGLIATRTPRFTWSAVPGSTKYYLQVEDSDDHILLYREYRAEDVTSGYKCSVLLDTILPDEIDFFWKIKAYSDLGGDNGWSGLKWFETVCSSSSKRQVAKR